MSKIEVLGGYVNINEKKALVKIWDDSLVVMFEKVLKQKFNIEASIEADWEGGDGEFCLIASYDENREVEKQIRTAFGEEVDDDDDDDDDFEETDNCSKKDLKGFLFKELFCNANITTYRGSYGDCASEFIYDLSDAELEHFKKFIGEETI